VIGDVVKWKLFAIVKIDEIVRNTERRIDKIHMRPLMTRRLSRRLMIVRTGSAEESVWGLRRGSTEVQGSVVSFFSRFAGSA